LIVAAILTFFGTLATGGWTFLIARMSKMQKLGQATHDLVNSDMGVALLVNVLACERLFRLTGEAADAEALEKARQLLDQHQARQKVADNR